MEPSWLDTTVPQGSKSLVVVVPTFRERDNLEPLLAQIQKARPGAHVLVVDDASGDGAPAWVKARPEFGQSLFLIARPSKQGLGTAYVAGFRWALDRGYDRIAQMDADLSHDPADLPRLESCLDRGFDGALASRYKGGIRVLNWPLGRLALSLAAMRYVRLLTGMPFSDPTGGFKCFGQESLRLLDLERVRSNGYAFQIEVTHALWQRGCRFEEVPVVFRGRQAGLSKMSGAIAREAARLVLKLAWHRLRGRSRPA